MFREPLIIPVAAFAAGILASHSISLSSSELIAGVLIFAALAIAARRFRSNRLMLTGVCLGMVCAGALTDVLHRPGPAPELESGEGETLLVSGCVVQPPVMTADREQFTLELERGARANVSLSLRDGESAPPLRYGQRIELSAKLRRPRNYRNPGAFDYVRYLARQQVYWTASARASDPITILKGRCGSRFEAAVFGLRVAALERIDRLYAGDEYATAMMEATLIGESGKLEKIWTEQFRRTGTYHTIVIAGMHIIVLAGTLLFLLRMLMVPETVALLIAAVGAWAYAAVCGGAVPVIRAAAGFTLYVIGRYMFRRGRTLNLLAAVALVYLAWDPGQLFEAAFQLSFLCVASIGAFAAPLTRRALARYRDAGRNLAEPSRDSQSEPVAAEFRVELRLLAETVALWTGAPVRVVLKTFEYSARAALWTAGMVILSGVIQIALALPMALYFHRLSITGLTANLVVVPLMNALVPVGFLAIFSGWMPVAILARWLLNLSQWAVDWHAQFEPSHRIPDPPFWLALALSAALVLAAITARLKPRWMFPALAAVFILFGLLIAAPFPADVARGSLELTAIDVGQGDGLVLTTPEGKVLLIDAGGFPAFGRKRKSKIDIGEDVISPYLWTRRIQHADIIATTHAHEDHVGGLKALIENFHPAEIWTGTVPEDSIETETLNAARASGVRVYSRTAGEAFDFGGARFEVLAPDAEHESNPRALNNDSLALRVSYGRHSFLLTGDIEKQIEWGMLEHGLLAKTTVLKVAHHGSKTSTTAEFLDAVQPEFAIVSAGYGNLFHHPHAEVIERLNQHHADVLRTDLSGLITVRSDGHRLTVTTMNDLANQRFIQPFQAW